jgi:glycosyltransferase involved in cell wall biosynthesis
MSRTEARSKRVMNILHVGCGYTPYPGGGALRAHQLIKGVSQDPGVKSIVVTSTPNPEGQYTDADPERADGVSIYRAPDFRSMVSVARRLTKREGVSVIHTHNARLALWFSLTLPNVPLALELHALTNLIGFKRQAFRYALKRATVIIVLAEAAKRFLQEHFSVSGAKIHVVQNGIDLERFVPSTSTQRDHREDCCIGYLGTFYRWQGVFELLEATALAMRANPRIRLRFVGHGPERAALLKRVVDLGLEPNVEIYGPVSPNDSPQELQKMDILVMPRPSSLETETTVPLKVFEFMACGKPIIASDVGGLMEVLRPEIDCVTYPAGSKTELATALVRLVEDHMLCRRLGTAARASVLQQPSWSDQARLLNALYWKLSAREAPAGV